MTNDTTSRIELAQSLIAEASRLALAAFNDPQLHVESKGPGDLVSEADFAIEKRLRAAITEAFPEDGIIGEEFGGTAPETGFCWLMDPIDGTVNFARKLGYFCVSMALLHDGRTIGAWTADPLQDEVFSAGPDGIARLNGKPIACASEARLGEAVVGLGFSVRHDRALGGEMVGLLFAAGAEHRRLGAGALCLAHVAAGRLDAYLEPHMNPWDAVGGLYIAACAGAVTNDYFSEGGLSRGAPVYAAAPALSDQLLAIMPEPFSGTPLHRQNEQRSAGRVAK